MEKLRFVIKKSENLKQEVNYKRVFIGDNPISLIKTRIALKNTQNSQNRASRNAFEWGYEDDGGIAQKLTAFAILFELTGDIYFSEEKAVDFIKQFLRFNGNFGENTKIDSEFEIDGEIIFEWIIKQYKNS